MTFYCVARNIRINHKTVHLFERIRRVCNFTLLGPGNIARPRAKTCAKLVGPFITGFQDDQSAFTVYQHFVLVEATVFRKTDSLASAILKQFCALLLHVKSIYLSIYFVKACLALFPRELRRALFHEGQHALAKIVAAEAFHHFVCSEIDAWSKAIEEAVPDLAFHHAE